MAQMTTELCEAKHGEVIRGLRHIEDKLDNALDMLNGNGRPGLRQTQSELERLMQEITLEKQRRDSWAMFLLRPALPLIYGAVLSFLYLNFFQ